MSRWIECDWAVEQFTNVNVYKCFTWLWLSGHCCNFVKQTKGKTSEYTPRPQPFPLNIN